MQGQRSALDSFPESLDLNQGSVSDNTGMDQSAAWNNMESQLSNYMLPSGEGNSSSVNAIRHNSHSFSGWNLGDSSSSSNLQYQNSNDGSGMEHGWSYSFSAPAGIDARVEEQRFEPTNALLRESGSSSFGSRVAGRNLGMQRSVANHIPLNANLNAGYMGDIDNGSWDRASSGNVGTSSGNFNLMENDGGSGSFSGSWGLCCKRKALEGTSAQFYSGGSSSCFPQSENIVRQTIPGRYNASSSLSISSPPVTSLNISNLEQLDPGIGVGARGVAFDVFPTSSVTGIAENTRRNYGVRGNLGQQESAPFDLPFTGTATRRSTICSSHQPSRPITFSDSLDLRPTTSVDDPPNQPHLMHAHGLPRSITPFPWNGASNLRARSSPSSLMLSGERGGVSRDEANLRSNLRNNAAEYPMFVSSTETRNLVQDPANWNLTAGSSSSAGGVPSGSRLGPGSGIDWSWSPPVPNVWIPHHNTPTQNHQRSSEVAPWTLFTSVGSESEGQRGHFSLLPSGSSSSSDETAMPSGRRSRDHRQLYPRSALQMEEPGEDVVGRRALVAAAEGRQRLVSE
ncbi:unnamed protein product, partial [Ilex paraguariensis]